MKLTDNEIAHILAGLALLEQQNAPKHKITRYSNKLWYKILEYGLKFGTRRTIVKTKVKRKGSV